jgi:hypothetical protein
MNGLEIRAVEIFVAMAAEPGQLVALPRSRRCRGAPARVVVTNN